MFNHIRSNSVFKPIIDEDHCCCGVDCNECIFFRICVASHSCFEDSGENLYDIMEMIEKWAKEHPKKTYADKYKEVFNIDIPKEFTAGINAPSLINAPSFCPHQFGFKCECDSNKDCIECRNVFWNQEYIEPEDK